MELYFFMLVVLLLAVYWYYKKYTKAELSKDFRVNRKIMCGDMIV